MHIRTRSGLPTRGSSKATAFRAFLPCPTPTGLAAISPAGLDTPLLLGSAATAKPLPDDHAAAALWWRISRDLTADVSTQLGHDRSPTTPWTPRLAQLIIILYAARRQVRASRRRPREDIGSNQPWNLGPPPIQPDT